MKNVAIILASGTGSRSGLNQPKQFFEVGGKALLEHSTSTFNSHEQISEIVIVSHPDFLDKTKTLVTQFDKVKKVIAGGETRQESSYNGVFSIESSIETNVLIHDAVRAFVTKDIISSCIEELSCHEAVCVATETSDTILQVDKNGKIVSVPNRKTLKCAQTPQCFKLELIQKAHKFAQKNGQIVTDDCGLILANNLADIFVVQGSSENRKITYPQDLEFAQWQFDQRKN